MRIVGIEGVAPGPPPHGHDPPRRARVAASGPGEAGLAGADRAGPAVGRGLHLRVDAGRVRLRLVRHRRVLPPHPRLAGLDVARRPPLVHAALEQALFTRRRGNAHFTATGLRAPLRRRRPRADSSGRRNTSSMEVCDGTTSGRRAARSGRGAAMRSPGRPPVARREDRQRFWAGDRRGLSSEDAAVAVRRVAAGRGAVVPRALAACHRSRLAPLSGRYLSFAEREEIALLAGPAGWRAGDRPTSRAGRRRRSRGSCGATRRPAAASWTYRATTAQWHAERRARRPKVAKLAANDRAARATCRTGWPAPIDRPDGAPVPGPDVRWIGRRHGRRQDRRWAHGVEPGADRPPAAGRLPR